MNRDLMIFNAQDVLLCILTNESSKSLNYWDAPYTEELNNASVFDFKCMPDHEDSKHIVGGNQVVFADRDGILKLFEIKTITNVVDGLNEYIQARCVDSVVELGGNVLEDIRPQNVTLEFALGRALTGQSKWRVGNVMDLGIKSTNFFYISSLEAVANCLETWGAELTTRIEVEDGRITGRYIDASIRGEDTGLLMEVGHNINGLTFTVETSHIKTLLYGRGGGVAIYDEEGEATGGYSRRIMFTDLVATHASHGFVKPAGQPFLYDDNARELYGIMNPDTGRREHREGTFENGSITIEDNLMRATWQRLQEINRPFYHASCNLIAMREVFGSEFDHEQIRLGDKVRLVDHETFTQPILTDTRVISITYDIAESDNINVELGDHRNLYSDDARITRIENGLNNGAWNVVPPIVGEGTPNRPPQAITGFRATGGFGQIHLFWDFQSIFNVGFYELHGSRSNNFTPSETTLIYRGGVSAFSHSVEPNQRWHYRVRAVNHHGTSGAWSNQVYAQTTNTRALDQLEDALNDLDNALELLDLDGEFGEAHRLLNLWRVDGTVEIDGGAIRANTIVGDRIVARSITADRLVIGDTTSLINNGDFTHDEIGANPKGWHSQHAGRGSHFNVVHNTFSTARAGTRVLSLRSDVGQRIFETNRIPMNMNDEIRLTITYRYPVATITPSVRFVIRQFDANGILVSSQLQAFPTVRSVEWETFSQNYRYGARVRGYIEIGLAFEGGTPTDEVHIAQVDARRRNNGQLIVDGTITTNHLMADSITANLIQSDSIVARHIQANAVTSEKITAGAITSDKIRAGAIEASHIAVGSITGDRIQANTITGDRLTANAVQVGFNANGNTLQLSPTALSFMQAGAVRGRLTGTGLDFNYGSREILRIAHSSREGAPHVRGLAIFTRITGDYINIGEQITADRGAHSMMMFDPNGTFYNNPERAGIHAARRLFVNEMGVRGQGADAYWRVRRAIINTATGDTAVILSSPNQQFGVALSNAGLFFIINGLAWNANRLQF